MNKSLYFRFRYNATNEVAFCLEVVLPDKEYTVSSAIAIPLTHFQWKTAPGNGEKWLKAYNWCGIGLHVWSGESVITQTNFAIPLRVFDRGHGPFDGDLVNQAEYESALELLDVEGILVYAQVA